MTTLGRNTGTTQSAVGQGIAYAYDAENHRVQMVAAAVPSGGASWTTAYGYDPAGRLGTVLDGRVSAVSPFTYAYQGGTNWVSGHSNADGSASINQYDALGRLTRVTAANASSSAINTYGYSYDAAGQKTQEAASVGTRDFTYDNQRELTGSTNMDGNNQPIIASEFSYLYDAIGNPQKKITAAGELGRKGDRHAAVLNFPFLQRFLAPCLPLLHIPWLGACPL